MKNMAEAAGKCEKACLGSRGPGRQEPRGKKGGILSKELRCKRDA